MALQQKFMTNRTLVRFADSLPHLDRRAAIRAVVEFDRCHEDAELFILSLMQTLNVHKMSPMKAFIEMSLLFDNSERVKEVTTLAMGYIALLFELPDLFVKQRSNVSDITEIMTFIRSDRCTLEWLTSFNAVISTHTHMVTDAMIVCIERLMTEFTNETMAGCISSLGAITKFLSIECVKAAFCDSNMFTKWLRRLFVKDMMPGNSSHEFNNIFSNDTDYSVNKTQLIQLDNIYSGYYDALKTLFRKLVAYKPARVNIVNWMSGVVYESYHSEYGRTKFDTEGWILAYNLEAVLTRFVIESRNALTLIDPMAPHMKNMVRIFIQDSGYLAVPGLSSWVSESKEHMVKGFMNGQMDEDVYDDARGRAEWEALTATYNEKEPNLMSVMFFTAAELLRNGLGKASMAREAFIREHRNGGETFPMSRLNYELRYWGICHRYPKRSERTQEFLSLILDFLLKTANYDSLEGKFKTMWPSLQYQYLPESLGFVVVKGLNAMVEWEDISRQRLQIVVKKLSVLFSSRKYLPNPVIAREIVEMFATMSRSEGPDSSAHITMMPDVLKFAYPAVVEFYSKVQLIGTDREFYERDSTRIHIIRLISFWMRWHEPRYYFQRNQHSETNHNFVFYLIEDLTHYIGDIINEFVQISDEPDGLKRSITLATTWMDLIECLADFSFECIACDDFAKSIAKLIVPFFNAYDTYTNMRDNTFWTRAEGSRARFITWFVSLFNKFRGYTTFMENFINKDHRYTDGLYDRILAYTRELPQTPDIEKLSRGLEAMINDLRSVTLNEEDDYGDLDDIEIPDDFQDPISMCIIKDPIHLPTSDYAVSRETFEQLKQHGCLDPISQLTFKPEDCYPDVALAKRIEEWVAEKRREKAAAASK